MDFPSPFFQSNSHPFDHVRALALLSWTAALRDETMFAEAVQNASSLGMGVDDAREILLQLYLFAGFPTCIEAFERLNRFAPPSWIENPPKSSSETESVRLWWERGLNLFSKIYGTVGKKLYHRMEEFHPELARWMITEGYGKVLGRSHIPGWVRELCIIPILAILGHPEPLKSHLRGALRLGVPRDWIVAILEDCRQNIHENTKGVVQGDWLYNDDPNRADGSE